jgi:hypothetical protein
MKILAGLALAAFMMVGDASAAVYYVASVCGSFSSGANGSNPVVSGTWVCPSAATLGVTGSLSVASEFLAYSSDYSNGEVTPVTDQTTYTFTGATLTFAADTVTSTGGSISNGPVSTDGLTYNSNNTNTPNGWQPGPTVLAGFYDTVTGFGTVTVGYTNNATGTTLADTGYAEIVYDYNFTVSSGTPEPMSMILFGGGLLAISLVGRKKFARK